MFFYKKSKQKINQSPASLIFLKSKINVKNTEEGMTEQK